MGYEELLIETEQYEIQVKEKNLYAHKGLCKGNRIAIQKSIETSAEKACILAEELGHYHTTAGDILDQSKVENRKAEHAARIWSYNKLIGLEGIMKAYQKKCTTHYEMADYLNVTVEFLMESLEYYRQKFGFAVEKDGYIIFFEPQLSVLKKV